LNGLAGCFDVACSAGAEGRTFIQRQSTSAPFHLAKPYWNGSVLVLQSVNATAGVFAGDRLTMDVLAADGAKVLMTTPSAHRVHTMHKGHAELDQVYHVGTGSWLEVMPELFIPQAGCRYRQRTQIRVDEGGELFYVETLAPGRVASGEVFAFSEVGWELELVVAGKRVARERYTLKPNDASLWSLRRFGPATYYGAAYLVSHRAEAATPLQEHVQDLAAPGRLVGMTKLSPSCWVIRMLAEDSVLLKSLLRDLRHLLSAQWPLLSADARKL
jgi:urease accessory protein